METFTQEKIHFNPSSEELRNLVVNSYGKIVRFVIDNNGDFHAADAFNYTHLNMVSREDTKIRGNLFLRNNSFYFKFKGVYDKEESAKIEQRLYRAGFQCFLDEFRN